MTRPRRPRLPLACKTPPAWAEMALADPLALLNDHAHLEKKAATTALELLHRWPDPNPPENWVKAMTNLARDEVEHLAVVTRLLARRGGHLTRHHRNPYARALHQQVRMGEGNDELVDRLMVASLIECRSCERFVLLAPVCEDRELADLYEELIVADYGHYRVFLDLAKKVEKARAVQARWREMLELEAEVIQEQPRGSRMHTWV
ncbi:MAG: tRNA isopentenyl-2-thiomethyl-A-37 hydroxylase MiaE [Planctomycetota bacterium]